MPVGSGRFILPESSTLERNRMTKNSRPTFWLSGTLGAVYLFVYLTYPAFFIWNPTLSAVPILGWLQLASTLAWFTALIAPSAFWYLGENFTPAKSRGYLLVALAWPGVLIILRVYLLATTGNAGFAYLINYPIFIFTDIVAPIVYVQMWRKLRTKQSPEKLVTNNFIFNSTRAD